MSPSASPLRGVTTLCLGSSATVGRTASRVQARGGRAIAAPTVRQQPVEDESLVDAVRALAAGTYVGLCLTSVAAVRAIARGFTVAGIDPVGVLQEPLVGSVGPATTGAIGDLLGVRGVVQPPCNTGQHLGRTFPPGEGSILLPVSDLATDRVAVELARRGYDPVRVTAYRTRPVARLDPAAVTALSDGQVDVATVTSPSTARSFVALTTASQRAGLDVASIGPVTSAACVTLGLRVVREAATHDTDGLVNAVVGLTAAAVA